MAHFAMSEGAIIFCVYVARQLRLYALTSLPSLCVRTLAEVRMSRVQDAIQLCRTRDCVPRLHLVQSTAQRPDVLAEAAPI